jgi:DNA modification methylase
METEAIKISDLKSANYNPRVMDDNEMEKLVSSIVAFGFVEPVIANRHPGRENIIIGGHQRVAAAQKLGIAKVPVVYVDLDIEKEKLLNLALNRISGRWDEEKLADVLKSIENEAERALAGFDSAEIDDLLRGINDQQKEDFDVDKEIEQIVTPTSKPGEVYELGKHRLICGDSTNPDDVAKLIGAGVIDMVFTDPPYNVGYKSSGRKSDMWSKAYGDDDYTPEQFEEFSYKAFVNFRRYLKEGGVYYICSGWSSWAAFFRSLVKLNLKPRGCIIWDKGHGGLGWSDYWYQQEMIAAGFNIDFDNGDESEIHELIAYGFDDNSKHYFATKKGGARLSDVWRVSREPVQSYLHPTQKPVKLIENAIYNSTKQGDAILDLFAGSGSTLIAAEKTGRRAFLCEKSPLFCDVIIKRYDKFAREKHQ